MTGGVSNIRFERIHFLGTNNGIRIQIESRDRGGDVHNIVFRDLDMKNVKNTINIYEYSDMETKLTAKGPVAAEQWQGVQPVTPLTPHFHDITIENLTSTSAASAGEVLGFCPEAPVVGLILRNVKIDANRGLTLRYTSVSWGAGISIESRDGKPISEGGGSKRSRCGEVTRSQRGGPRSERGRAFAANAPLAFSASLHFSHIVRTTLNSRPG